MQKFRILVLIVLLTIAIPFLIHYRAWAVRSPRLTEASTGHAAPPLGLRIISPKPNEELTQTFVAVRFQSASPASASGTSSYELRLDGREPVQTGDSSYTFNGLALGTHYLTVQATDVGGAPLSGAFAEVKFAVAAPTTSAKATSLGQASYLPDLPLPLPPASNLPGGNGSLPLLSVIGFGILVGGVISALRTRPAHKQRL